MADKADAEDLSQLATEPWVLHREVAVQAMDRSLSKPPIGSEAPQGPLSPHEPPMD